MGSLIVAAVLALVFASSAAAASFEAHGSVEQVYATGLEPGQMVDLIDKNDDTIETNKATAEGGVLFRRVKPGHEVFYEQFLEGIIGAASTFPGHMGVDVFRPASATAPQASERIQSPMVRLSMGMLAIVHPIMVPDMAALTPMPSHNRVANGRHCPAARAAPKVSTAKATPPAACHRQLA